MSLPDIHAVQLQMHQLQVPVSASELHGAACGWIAGGGNQAGNWLAAVLADTQQPAAGSGSALDALFNATAKAFGERDFAVELLLPDEDTSLAERSQALFDWCRGFLGAFGLAAGQHAPLSDDGKDALADIARLAASQPQDEGDDEDEQALVEIEEYVRVVAMLLHADCADHALPRAQLH